MQVVIDKNSGYCFGVEYAIQMAEEELDNTSELYCLGDIVHNDVEINRLKAKGLRIITREQLAELKNCKVLIRAHGEPPETYHLALKNNIELIDASCPVVLKLQNRIKNSFDDIKKKQGQLLIYGQKGHAEVIGLLGQTQNEAIVISGEDELEKIDYTKPIVLYSQTTKSTKGFYNLKKKIEEKISKVNGEVSSDFFDANDSICRQVSNREPQLEKFSKEFDVIIFVSGKKSSNGKALFNVCKSINPRSYFIEDESELQPEWFTGVSRVGIAGATSTPVWLMEKVRDKILSDFNNK
jgi:4-hydroxy-3-methylbut-2-enyl diphosphate reductase